MFVRKGKMIKQKIMMQDYHPFFNFSSYGNAKLFSHCRCSFQRNMKKKKVKYR